MASTPANAPAQTLPLFYGSLAPLSSQLHPTHGLKPRTDMGFTRNTHAVPVTVDEFAIVQRHYPIVFGLGENPAPLALIGLQEGQNLYLTADNQWEPGQYIPAFIRRYPFMLARLSPDSEELSLCFDDTSAQIVAGDIRAVVVELEAGAGPGAEAVAGAEAAPARIKGQTHPSRRRGHRSFAPDRHDQAVGPQKPSRPG